MSEIDSGAVGEAAVGVKSATARKSEGPGFRLTVRDLDLLQFLHEQQFASLAMLFFQFFDRRTKAADPLPENLWVTRQRVAMLRQAGLISTQKVFTESKALYLLTRVGYDVLRQRRELALDAPPPDGIDFRYYEHDKRVSLCRVALERDGKSYKWYPDRFLRKKLGYPFGDKGFVRFPKGMIPDGGGAGFHGYQFRRFGGDRVHPELLAS
jgi:hypothetical protein